MLQIRRRAAHVLGSFARRLVELADRLFALEQGDAWLSMIVTAPARRAGPAQRVSSGASE